MKEAGLSRVVLQADPLVICVRGARGQRDLCEVDFGLAAVVCPVRVKSSPYVSMYYWTDTISFVATFL